MNWTVFYIKSIQLLQKTLLLWSVVLFLFVMPVLFAFNRDYFTSQVYTTLFTISLASVTFVMMVRPLADIFGWKWLRSLVILRKGFGVLSASIIVGFILGKIIVQGGWYFAGLLEPAYWSMEGYKLLAHLGDITGVILLATSNKLSKQVLGKWWKRIQKLAYVYFYAGAFYEFLALQSLFAIEAIVFVTLVVVVAWVKNNFIKIKNI